MIYNYAVGRMSSRQIEKATYEDVASRYICGDCAHSDHDTICAFRVQNASLFQAVPEPETPTAGPIDRDAMALGCFKPRRKTQNLSILLFNASQTPSDVLRVRSSCALAIAALQAHA